MTAQKHVRTFGLLTTVSRQAASRKLSDTIDFVKPLTVQWNLKTAGM